MKETVRDIDVEVAEVGNRMKTLIINGSPRINGDTASLIKVIKGNIAGEYRIIDAYRCSISPCLDCRFCWKNTGCVINDEMQEIYEYIQICDNILIASPIYFSELTGKILDVGSRLQTYFCAKYFRNEEPILKSKKGAVVLVGGGDGSISKPYETACILLHHMNCHNIHDVVFSHNTNVTPAIADKQTLEGIHSILDFFNNVK